MNSIISRLNLKTGISLAIIFPGIFTFAQSSVEATDLITRFLNFFIFILIIWILNYALADFTPVIRKQPARLKRKLYLNILFTSAASVPVYLTLSYIFDQEEVTLSYVFNNNYSVKSWLILLIRVVLFNAGVLLTKYLYDNNIVQRTIILENEILKREHINAVHESLKQQIDPHFLFNSLNTLQSLVKQNTEQALYFISELSLVYRYMLHRRDNKYVTLKDEIDFLRSYLYLLKIRFGDAIQTQIEVKEQHLSTLIPPHTLQMLAENTVKHNKLSIRDPLKITVSSNGADLVVSNNIRKRANKPAGSGMGLNNINSRYHLLFDKEIRIDRKTESFNVYLPIINGYESIDNRG